MLGTLLVITLGAGAFSGFRLTEPWVVIPPAIMLGIFLLLLRECARSDAARARRLARAAEATSQAAGVAQPRRRAAEPRRAAAAAGSAAAAVAETGAAGTGAAGTAVAGTGSAGAGVTAPDEDLEPVAESGQTAQIIDLTARARDQLYDQYEDAAARAVGD